ncbi:MAG: AMP-binding protein, partial [Clostridia bacterium]|nr:AMP-binding protein [Clostridia bacterium]
MKYKTERELNQDTLLKDGDYTTNRDVVERIARYIPDRQVLADLDEYKNIRYYTALDIYKQVSAIGSGLMDMGLEGKHIAICADNSVRYILCDIAVSGVGVVTPIDREATPELMTTLLNKIDADAVICSADLVEKITEVQKDVETLQTIITIDKKVEGYTSLDEVMERG